MIFRQAQEGHFWPPYSPDLNPLDFCVWGYVQDQVRRIQPESIAELQRAVEDVAGTMPEEMLRDAAQNVRKRAKACIEATSSTSSNYPKNADSQLSSPIFEFEIHFILSELNRFRTVQLAC